MFYLCKSHDHPLTQITSSTTICVHLLSTSASVQRTHWFCKCHDLIASRLSTWNWITFILLRNNELITTFSSPFVCTIEFSCDLVNVSTSSWSMTVSWSMLLHYGERVMTREWNLEINSSSASVKYVHFKTNITCTLFYYVFFEIRMKYIYLTFIRHDDFFFLSFKITTSYNVTNVNIQNVN